MDQTQIRATVALDGTGHALMAEKPDEVLDALVEFLTSPSALSTRQSA